MRRGQRAILFKYRHLKCRFIATNGEILYSPASILFFGTSAQTKSSIPEVDTKQTACQFCNDIAKTASTIRLRSIIWKSLSFNGGAAKLRL
jgi:hypothetical protein